MTTMDESDRSRHRLAWDLMPWVVNGSANEAERRLVAAHLAGCGDCRDEFDFQCQLQRGMAVGGAAPAGQETGRAAGGEVDTDADADPAADTDAALQRFWAGAAQALAEPGTAGPLPGAARRVGPSGRAAGAPLTEHAAAPAGRWPRLLAAAVVVQAIGLAALAGALWDRPRPADYQTLGRAAAPAPASTLRLVAAPRLQIGELGALLARAGLQVVESSADGAILGLAPRAGGVRSQSDTLALLRADPGVLLAEPVLPAHAAALPAGGRR